MKLQKICLLLPVLLSAFLTAFGQNKIETVEGETWLQQYGIYYPTPFMTFRYDRYSKDDTVKFREKLDLLKAAKFADEWQGNYVSGFPDEVGTSSFRVDSNAGFVDYYVYSCFPELRYLNYGKIVSSSDFIQTIPEFAPDSPRTAKPVKYIKVKWGSQHYLVEESSLLAFAEKAAGIYVEPDVDSSEESQKWSNHWVKSGLENDRDGLPQIEGNISGLPEFPGSYKKFQRSPIAAKIISVGKRTIEAEKQFGDAAYTQYFQDAAIYPVIIGAGKSKGVKTGMRFEIFGTGEEVFITEVNQNSAAGFIARNTDEYKNDVCNDKTSKKTICPKLKSALKVKTEIGKLWFY